MAVSPLDYRYGRNEVKSLFTEESKLSYMLKVEEALAKAQSEYGLIPVEAYSDISRTVNSGEVSIRRVKEIEAEIRHDVMSIVRALTEKCGTGAKYVHFGVTSNDIIDTSTALQLRDFFGILMNDMFSLQDSLVNLVEKYKNSMMLGRTHGQHASPITFGLKMSVFLSETNRHIERLSDARKRILAGKILGPVGTGAALGEKALEIQERVMDILGLTAEEGATQLVGRDRHIEYLSVLNNIATSLEKFATEIRNLQRPELGEVSEFFDTARQVGSSSMPSKMNPITSENIVSIARLIRSLIIPEYEAAVTWHERDLTNSALERFTIPYSSILIDHSLVKMTKVFSELIVNTERMGEALKADPFVMSESVVSELTRRGMPRQDAHETVRKASMESYGQKIAFKDSLIRNGVLEFIEESRLDQALKPENFLGKSVEICNRSISRSRKLRSDLME